MKENYNPIVIEYSETDKESKTFKVFNYTPIYYIIAIKGILYYHVNPYTI